MQGCRDRSGPRDVDAAARGRFIKAALLAGIPGLIIGAAGGWFANGVPGALMLGPVVGFVAASASVVIAEAAGAAAGVLHHPRGGPRRKEHSRARALLMRGDLDAALDDLEAELLDDPDDLEACLLAARSCREAGRLEEAVTWFRRGRSVAERRRSPALAGVVRELVELLDHRMGEPRRAAPELARLAEREPHTEHGAWARARLAEIKEEMRGEGGPR